MKTSGKKQGRLGRKKVVEESSSEEEMEIEFQDSSEYESEDDYYDARCAECDTCFRGKELCMAIGCDSEHWMLVPPEMHRPRSDWEDRKGDTSNAIYMQLLLSKKI